MGARRAENPPPPVLYTVAELAGAWRCSPDHIYDLIAVGELSSTQLGTGRAKTRISEAAADDFIRRRSRPARRTRAA